MLNTNPLRIDADAIRCFTKIEADAEKFRAARHAICDTKEEAAHVAHMFALTSERSAAKRGYFYFEGGDWHASRSIPLMGYDFAVMRDDGTAVNIGQPYVEVVA
ncbi:hypothetical protein ACDA63_07365 [Uliginosibacterium sp. sgz301328]|uniref:hypothetical protein n=1 Tax=Uliginosibacterium sp. sgz301328 TaxID=3243764 RepID=UPI00359EC2E1